MIKYYRREKLDQALHDGGIISKMGAYQWLLRMEKNRRIICPHDPISGQRKFTARQVESIIRAFQPGGTGWWTPDGLPIPKAVVRPDEALAPIPMTQSPRIKEIKGKG